jgi:hypothetical protein
MKTGASLGQTLPRQVVAEVTERDPGGFSVTGTTAGTRTKGTR